MNPTTTRHEFVDDVNKLDPTCGACGLPATDSVHDDPADDLPLGLGDAIDVALEALEELATHLRRAGGRDSDHTGVRHFCAYHLADVEGNDGGAGWLAGQLLADDLRALRR